MSNQQYLNSIKPGAIAGWHKYKIAPSITGAQAALESGWGSSKLAKPPYNNNFGIKASPDWTGRKISMSTQEYINGKWITINDDFRAYDTLSDSIADHSAFFTNTEWRKNNYREVVGQIDYKKAANALQKAGYATDPGYPQKLINIIEQHNLQSWDQEALRGETTNTVTPPTIPVSPGTNTTTPGTKKKVVGGSISSSARNGISQFTLSVIGDSLGVGTEPFLKKYPWARQSYDNYGSRQWTHGTDIYNGITALNNMKNAGNLNNNVVFILGTNRGVNPSEIDEAVSICGRDRNLILVDTTSEVNHRTKVSAEYEKAASRHDNVFYANWSSYSRASIGSWYHADGANGTRIHMNSTGYQRHADFIVQAVYEANQIVFEKSVKVDPIKTPTEGVNIYDIEYDDGMFTSPKGDSSIYNKALNDQLGFRARKGQIMWIERKYSGSETDSASLLDAAIGKMKEASVPAAQYTVSMRYFPETISIGDTGIFVDHEFDPPLYIQARVLAMTTSESNPSGNTVTIGNVIEVTPQAKSDLLSIQQQLQDTRDMSLSEYWKEKPVTLQVTTSNGLILKPQESEIFAQLVKRFQSEHVVTNGSVLVDMYNAKSKEGTITVTGSIKDNYIDSVDEVVSNINYDEYDDVNFDDGPIDVDSNPQGPDVVDINDYNNIRSLIVDQFDVELLDINGQVIGTEKAYVYEDSTFIFKIISPMRHINKIRILSPHDCTFDNISAIDESVNLTDTIDSTRVYVKAFQEEKEVTHEFKNFKWSRISQNTRLDNEWNDINKWNESNGIDLDVKDIYGNKSTFICRMYDDEYNFVEAISVGLSISTDGKSAYDLAVEAGFEGTLDEWVESLRGSDGVNGTEGPKGEDGQSTFIHVAWAHSPMGDGFSTSDSTDKLYMGTYVDEIEADSENYSDYKWTRVKGDKGDTGDQGPRGLQGLEGPEGKQGIEGPKGLDGKSSYTHIAYATGDQGQTFSHETFAQATHIGIYVSDNQNSSDNWQDYKWTLIKGANGARGLEGAKGEDGRTPYFHTAWASSSNGQLGFSTTDSTGKLYLGTVTTFEPDDPTDYTKYTWTLIKGEKGDKGDTGKDGVAGKDGVGIQKTEVRYATSTSGTTEPSTGWNLAVPSTTPGDYLWTKTTWTYTDETIEEGYSVSRIGKDGNTGKDGVAGKDGVGIKSTVINYATSSSGTTQPTSGWTTTVPSVTPGNYLWTRTVWTYTDNDVETGYSVSRTGKDGAKGDTGEQGPRGLTGAQGPQGDQGIKGADGANGLSSYTHIAYADTITGTGFSHSDASKPFIGIYTNNDPTSSGIASKYTWSKWHGEDGSNGVQGPKGADGLPSYTHFAYASNATGTSGFSTTDSLNKSYLGIYTDNTKTDSEDPSKYTWTLIKGATGATGPRGVQGLQGPEGKQGIKGDTGADGKSSYTHIAYATGNQGQSFNHSTFDAATYVGMYVSDNQNSSDNWSDYEWTLIKGRDGSQGVRGPQGPEGKTPYFHVAYANNSTGTSGFSINDSANKLYIGTYTDFEPDDSSDPAKYNWTLVKGAKGDKGDRGPQGIEGAPGANGTPTYTWVQYADTPTSGMSNSPVDKKYIGLSFNQATQTESGNYDDYQWSLMPQNIEIGGRNYFSAENYIKVRAGQSHGYLYRLSDSGALTIRGTDNQTDYDTMKMFDLEANTEYIISFSVPMNDRFAFYDTEGTPLSNTSTWNSDYTQLRFTMGNVDGYIGGKFYPLEQTYPVDVFVMAEKGNTPTDWSRPPEDTQSQIDDTKEQVKKTVKTITEEYYQSTSATSQTGGGWTETAPTWQEGKFIFIRSKITYVDNTTDYTPIVNITGAKGDTGPKGDTGAKGATGSTGPRGATGTSVSSVTEYYLATSASSGILSTNSGFTTSIQTMTATNKYLWNYEKINFSDGTSQPTIPVIIGVYGDKGQTGSTGATGRSITEITEHYLASNLATGVTRSTSGWTTTMQQTTPEKKYLWNYETIKWSSGTTTTYVEPIVIGVHGEQGPQGPQGDTGPKGATGSQGPRGDAGVGIDGITEYYLATSASSGVTTATSGWTTSIQTMTATNKYLWNYERINFSDGTNQPTIPVIVGAYGDKGATGAAGSTGATGRSITAIQEYYLATSASTGVTRSTANWSTTMQTTTPTNKYLWNYEKITWSSGTTTTYVEPIIIGIHGEQGPQGPQGPQGIQGPSGSNGQSQWVHIRYSANSNGSGMTTSPVSTTKYVGIAVTNSATAPAYTGFTWSKYVGENGSTGARGPQGLPGTNGDDGVTTYTWVRYADTPTSGMNQYPDGKKYIGLAFNKTTQTESSNYGDYKWSLMPQNIEIGGRNYFSADKYVKLRNSQGFGHVYQVSDSGALTIRTVDGSGGYGTMKMADLEANTSYVITFSVPMNNRFSYHDTEGNLISIASTWSSDSTQLRFTMGNVDGYIGGKFYPIPQSYPVDVYVMIEKGNTSTDWTLAPEDVQAKIDEKASAEDLDETVRKIETESTKIASLRTDVDITKNNMLITHTDEYVNKITTTESKASELEDRVVLVEETKENVDTFFQFDDAFTIGKSNSQTKLRMTNDEIQFLDGETKGTYITGNTMVSQNITIQDKLNLTKHTMETEGDVTVIRFTG